MYRYPNELIHTLKLFLYTFSIQVSKVISNTFFCLSFFSLFSCSLFSVILFKKISTHKITGEIRWYSFKWCDVVVVVGGWNHLHVLIYDSMNIFISNEYFFLFLSIWYKMNDWMMCELFVFFCFVCKKSLYI